MLLISRYIRRMAADTSCHQFCVGITKMIRKHYRFRFPVSRMETHPEERLCASVILFSRLRREVWLVGDCQCLIGGDFFDNPKPYEAHLAEIRGQRVKDLLADGVAESELLKAHDPAREVMIPTMLQVMQNQNKTYAVIDGFPIPEDKVPIITLGFQPNEIIFASDGYPYLCSTLAESERKLEEQRLRDPLNIDTFKATKAFINGNNSFDDRTYVRFTV